MKNIISKSAIGKVLVLAIVVIIILVGVGGGYYAMTQLSAPSPTATPSPNPSATPSLSPSPTYTPSPTPSPKPSPTATPKPAPTITLTSNATIITMAEAIELTATMSISKTGPVILYWSIGSSGFIYQSSGNMTNGVFTRTFGFGQSSTWQFKVYWQGDLEYNSVESNIVTVTVGK